MSLGLSVKLISGRRARALGLAITVFAMSIIQVTPAFSQNRVERLEVSLASDVAARTAVIAVSETLPLDTPLPASVSLHIPTGSRITWSGELAGGSAEGSVMLEPDVATGTPYDRVNMTLTRFRTAYIEAVLSDRLPAPGTPTAMSFAYIAPTDADSARVSVEIPAGSEITSVSVSAQTEPGTDGATIHYVEYENVKTGDTLGFDVSYTVPSDEPTYSDEISPWTLVVIVGIVVALVALPFVRRMKRRCSKA